MQEDWWAARAAHHMKVLDPILSSIIKESQIIRNVTDIGTGQGHILLEIARRVRGVYPDVNITGIDKKHGLSDGVLAAGVITPRKGSYFKLGIPDKSIDILTLIYIAQALNVKEQYYMLEWAVRKLTAGGNILFVDVYKRKWPFHLIDWVKHHLYNGFAGYNIKYRQEWIEDFMSCRDLEVLGIYDLPDRSIIIHAKKKGG